MATGEPMIYEATCECGIPIQSFVPIPEQQRCAICRIIEREENANLVDQLKAAPFVYAWHDVDGTLGHKGWWEVRLTPVDDRRFYAYEPTLERAVRVAAELAHTGDREPAKEAAHANTLPRRTRIRR